MGAVVYFSRGSDRRRARGGLHYPCCFAAEINKAASGSFRFVLGDPSPLEQARLTKLSLHK